MATKRATRRCGNIDAPTQLPMQSSNQIISDYVRGSKIAAWMFAGMFAFMALGTVVWGW